MKKASSSTFLRVGVTGGIGSGKSIVCSLFAKKGIPVISADDLAKELMQRDEEIRRKLIRLLGPATYNTDGSLNRPFVAQQIFSSKVLQGKVNHLVHPRVEAEVERWFAAMAEEGKPAGIMEAALIYESGYDKSLDVVVVVDAPEDVRIKRVVDRDGTEAEEVTARMKAQMSAEAKKRKADYLIRNNGSIEELESSVAFLVSILTTISRKS